MSMLGTRLHLPSRLRPPGQRSRLVRLGALAGCVVLLTGCLRVQTAIHVNDDGSGTVSVLLAIDTAAIKQFCQQFGQDSCAQSVSGTFSPKDIDRSSLPPGTTVAPYKSGTYEGVRVTAPFRDPGEIVAVLGRLSNAVPSGDSPATSSQPQPTPRSAATTVRPTSTPAPEGATASIADTFETLSVRRQGSGWKFDAIVPPVNLSSNGSTDALGAAFSQAMAATFLKDASFTVNLKLPGKVVKSNADQVGSDGSLTWKLDIFSNQPRTLSAVTATAAGAGNLFPVLPIAGGLIVAIVAIAGLIVLRRRRRGRESANGQV